MSSHTLIVAKVKMKCNKAECYDFHSNLLPMPNRLMEMELMDDVFCNLFSTETDFFSFGFYSRSNVTFDGCSGVNLSKGVCIAQLAIRAPHE